MYPLRFRPIFRDYVWGGRRLETLLGKRLGDGGCFAESWEIVDHGIDQSVVQAGNWQGQRLGDLVRQSPIEICGFEAARFPLLFKFLDARKALSVQVHPNDQQAALLDPPDLGKTEAWVVLHAEPGSRIYAGLRRGIDRETFAAHITKGTAEECLHVLQPEAGDCIFIPAGTVHAIGAGLVIRRNPTGQRHHVSSLRLESTGRRRSAPAIARRTSARSDRTSRPVQLPRFVCRPANRCNDLWPARSSTIDRHSVAGDLQIGGDGHLHIVAVVSGVADIDGDPCLEPFATGQTCLLPAGLDATTFRIQSPATLLDMWC